MGKSRSKATVAGAIDAVADAMTDATVAGLAIDPLELAAMVHLGESLKLVDSVFSSLSEASENSHNFAEHIGHHPASETARDMLAGFQINAGVTHVALMATYFRRVEALRESGVLLIDDATLLPIAECAASAETVMRQAMAASAAVCARVAPGSGMAEAMEKIGAAAHDAGNADAMTPDTTPDTTPKGGRD